MIDEEIEITDEDIRVPIAELVVNDNKRVKISDMADYCDVFFAIENTVYSYWESNADLADNDVIRIFVNLLRDLDRQKEGTLESEISMGIKAILTWRNIKGMRPYTAGEIASCISFLLKIAKNHKSPDGRGYLKWIKTFFEGRMPKTVEEQIEYTLKNEM